MNKLCCLFLLYTFFAHAHLKDPFQEAPTHNIPKEKEELIIGNFIDPKTGLCLFAKSDLIVNTEEKLALTRFFSSIKAKKKNHNDTENYQLFQSIQFSRVPVIQWGHIPQHTQLTVYQISPDYFSLSVSESNGATMLFKFSPKTNTLSLDDNYYKSTNACGEEVGAIFDARNTRCLSFQEDSITLQFKDGKRAIYKFLSKTRETSHYLLEKEELFNGKKIIYIYDHNNNLCSIEARNPKESCIYSSLTLQGTTWISHLGEEVHYFYTTKNLTGTYPSNLLHSIFKGKKVFSQQIFLLSSVQAPSYRENYFYDKQFLLQEVQQNDRPICQFSYQIKNSDEYYRVKEIYVPESESSMRVAYRIFYDDQNNETKTIVSTPNKSIVTYCYAKQGMLKKIEHKKQNSQQIKSKKFTWNNHRYLSEVSLFDENHNVLYQKRFVFDSKGNPIRESFIGNLSGESLQKEEYVIEREYDPQTSLLLKESDGNVMLSLTYLNNTNLIKTRTIQGNDGLYVQEIRTYDSDNNLIQIDTKDDAETQTFRYKRRERPPHLHKVDALESINGTIHFHYDFHGNLAQEDHYDEKNQFLFSIYKEYNAQGLLISESNALGERTHYTYDSWGNLISQTSPSGTQYIEYDYKHRPIKLSAELNEKTYAYDQADRLIQEKGPSGLKIYQYDALSDQPTKIEHNGNTEYYQYDSFGRMISCTKNSRTTQWTYNSRGQITKVIHPDQITEEYRYYLNGKLKSFTDAAHRTFSYIYDSFGRVIKISYPEGEETFVYNAYNLIQHTNLEGHTTTYTYDKKNKTITENKAGRHTQYSYDSRGNLLSIKKEDEVAALFAYDALNRVIQEETPPVKIFYSYDARGNKTSIKKGCREEKYEYDALGRIIQHTDAQGKTTITKYVGNQTIIIHPNGAIIIETKNSQNRVIQREMAGVFKRKFFYSIDGDLIREEEEIYKQGQYTKTLTTYYTYTQNGQVASIAKGEQSTIYTYTPTGNLQTVVKPNGSIITYTYDLFDHLTMISTNKQTLSFQYNKLGSLLKTNGCEREYDEFGNITKESFCNGHSITKKYDAFDRVIQRKISDKDSIYYQYQDSQLKKIFYKNHVHDYSYSQEGDITTSGLIQYKRNSGGQIVHVQAPHFFQECLYDVSGNMTFLTPNHHYTYDSLNQLTSEHDSRFNAKDTNDLDQFPDHLYDDDGNLLIHEGPRSLYQLLYDDFGRLIQAKTKDLVIFYTYDGLGRRLSKKTCSADAIEEETYAYDDFEEVLQQNANVVNIKILGQEQHPVLFDLNDSLVVPIFDVVHQPRLLLHPKTKNVVAHYDYDPFGLLLDHSKTPSNPWKFASKHYDEETGLIYFGKRYYDPLTHRWITPDPVSPKKDLPNPYVFAKNNPLRYTDYVGLFSIAFQKETPAKDPPDHLIKMYQEGEENVNFYGKLFFINGINTNFDQARSYAKYISEMAGNQKVYGIYNPTTGNLFKDLCLYAAKPFGRFSCQDFYIASRIRDEFIKFDAENRDSAAKLFIVSTSGGTLHVKNALLITHETIRKRVQAFSIAPAVIIPTTYCHRAWHFASHSDPSWIIPALGNLKHIHELQLLHPHPKAPLMDHAINSPTFFCVLQKNLTEYIESHTLQSEKIQ